VTATHPGTHVGTDLADKLNIVEVTSEFGLRVDTHEWDRLTELLTDPVVVDYTMLHGGEPMTTDPDGVVRTWRKVLENLRATQHLMAGHVTTVTGDTASCVTNLVAFHDFPNDYGDSSWTLGGRYEFELRRTVSGWLISKIVLVPRWASGNRTIMQLAGSKNAL
jgi:hypothetical protein